VTQAPTRSAQVDAMLRDRARADGTVPRGTAAAIARSLGCGGVVVSRRIRALGLRIALAIDEHGTHSRSHTGCPCEPCRAFERERKRDQLARLQPADAPHGTLYGYTGYRCRCPECTAALRDHMRAYRQRQRAS